MIRQIMTKRFFLRQPSEPATAGDVQVARDLADTLAAHLGECVGMAANMIGERKRIVAVVDGAGGILVMLNPEIVSAEGPYGAEEGCLSLPGTRTALRYLYRAFDSGLVASCDSDEVVARHAGERLPYTSV